MNVLGINEDYVVFEVTSASSNNLVDLKGTQDDSPKGSLHKTMDFAIDVFSEVCIRFNPGINLYVASLKFFCLCVK